ncbi:hypothetical protein SKAU_G00119530 [Synaphobranchus kaupii]|uniref:Uncharacterized protein n=1 Tax=Synaphobranchus kaupii TaxID=118154 RepID=A0A9Q1J045_SYNKA|nr:hypothetical protein SKAU_G00119530 [Synaphobranchus kaupii]
MWNAHKRGKTAANSPRARGVGGMRLTADEETQPSGSFHRSQQRTVTLTFTAAEEAAIKDSQTLTSFRRQKSSKMGRPRTSKISNTATMSDPPAPWPLSGPSAELFSFTIPVLSAPGPGQDRWRGGVSVATLEKLQRRRS